MSSVTWPPDPNSHKRVGREAIELQSQQAHLGVKLAQLVASSGQVSTDGVDGGGPTAQLGAATAVGPIIKVRPHFQIRKRFVYKASLG